MVIVRDFGNDAVTNSPEELQRYLADQYNGKSVSIVTKTHSGLNVPHFVDISVLNDELQIVGSYDSAKQYSVTDFFSNE